MGNGDGPTGSSSSGGTYSPGEAGTGFPGLLGNGDGDGGIGVIGSAADGTGVIGTVASGVGVFGTSGGTGAGVVGWAGAGVAIDGGVFPVTLPGTDEVGVYGYVGGDGRFRPSRSDASACVWGDSPGNTVGILGTSESGTGVEGETKGGGQSGVAGIDGSTDGGNGTYGRSTAGTGANGQSTSGAGVSGTSTGGAGGTFDSHTGPGVSGTSHSGPGGVLQSSTSAQLRLVPSSIPLEQTNLLETGQVGDLYMYSDAHEVGSVDSETLSYNTLLWLCVIPKQTSGSQAVWVQVAFGDSVGG
jgi:hypothetical protein